MPETRFACRTGDQVGYIEIIPVFSAVDIRFPGTRRYIGVPVIILLVIFLLIPGCRRGGAKGSEAAYVSAPQVNLRDRMAALYNRTGTVYNGEKVEVLEKSKRFVRVRSPRGEIGWMEVRYLADNEIYNAFAKLAADNRQTPVQAGAVTRASLNMHVDPGRDTEHLFQLKEGEKVAVLRRSTAEKPQPAAVLPTREDKKPKLAGEKESGDKPSGPALEDWLLVRDPAGHTGWVLSRMLDVDVPLEIGQYSEGQRIVAYFVLNLVQDAGKKVPQYLVLLTEPHDGLPWDYSQARIFTWNLKRHRYETAYRERNLNGVFPVRVGSEDFGKDGVLPVFALRVRRDNGDTADKKYRLIGPIVRRVMSPEEEQRERAERAARVASRSRSRRSR